MTVICVSVRRALALAGLLFGVTFILWNSPVTKADKLWTFPLLSSIRGQLGVQCDGPTTFDLCFAWDGTQFEALHAGREITEVTDGQVAWGMTFVAPVSGIAIGAPFGTEEIFVTNGDGRLYAFNASDGAQQWSADTRRESCLGDLGDTLQAAPAIQERRLSNSAFQSAQAGDLIFVVTYFGCGTTTANQVIAFDSAGNKQWTFNPIGTEQMDIGSQGCVVDYSSNTLFCGTKLRAGAFQNTLWALDTTNGAKLWARNVGSIVTSPVLSGGRLYVATDDGQLSAIDPATGTDLWIAPVPVAAPFNNIRLTPAVYSRPAQALVVLTTDTGGYLHAVADQGDHGATEFWSPVNLDVGIDSSAVALRGTGFAYVHATDGTVHQLDLRTGQDKGTWLPTIAGRPGVLSVDHTAIGQPADRLMTTSRESSLGLTGFVARSGIPFPIGVTGGPFTSDDSASVYAADLELTMSAPAQVAPGANIDYTLTVINHGPDWATDVTLIDQFLATATSLSVSQGTVERASFPLAGFVGVIASFGDLAPGAGATLTARVTAPSSGTVTNSASVVSGERDPNPSNNQASVTSTIVTAESIKNDVTQFLRSGDITQDDATSFLAKLDAAAKARALGNCAVAADIYQAFIAELQALSGNKVSVTAASVMIGDAKFLVAHCP